MCMLMFEQLIHESIINDMQSHLFTQAEKHALQTDQNDDDDVGLERFYRWQPDTRKLKQQEQEEITDDIESNSSDFLDMLLGCLSRLNKMQEALEVIQQRTIGELRRVTETLFLEAERKGDEPAQFLRVLVKRFIKVLDMYRMVYDKLAMVLELVVTSLSPQ